MNALDIKKLTNDYLNDVESLEKKYDDYYRKLLNKILEEIDMKCNTKKGGKKPVKK